MSHGETDAGAVGEPLEGVSACLDQAVIAEDGRHVGELLLRTPTAMLGTYDGEQIIRNNFRDGWLATGDRFAMAPDTGKFYFIDRLRNIIACGGEKLSAGLIRRVVLDHPEVVSARIEARPDDALGAVPVATVRFRDGCALTTGEVLTAWCLKHLRRIEVPRSFCIDPELPISHK